MRRIFWLGNVLESTRLPDIQLCQAFVLAADNILVKAFSAVRGAMVSGVLPQCSQSYKTSRARTQKIFQGWVFWENASLLWLLYLAQYVVAVQERCFVTNSQRSSKQRIEGVLVDAKKPKLCTYSQQSQQTTFSLAGKRLR